MNLLLMTLTIFVQEPPPASWHVLAPPGGGWSSEVSVAIDRANPDRTVLAALGSQKGSKIRISNFSYYSQDFGKTVASTTFPNPDGRVQGDDSLAASSEGRIYHAYIAFTGLFDPTAKTNNTGVFVNSSSDGGQTWSDPVPVADHINMLMPFEDKPYLVVDRTSDRFKGCVYIAWTRFEKYGSNDPQHRSHICFSRSSDQGTSWQPFTIISDEPGDCQDSDNTVEGVVPSVGVNGEIFLVWAGPKGLYFDRSTDGGITFGTDQVIQTMPGGWDIPLKGKKRHNGMPVTGTDISFGPFRGSLYVNWIDERNGHTDVFCMASRDNGSSWSDPVRVNNDAGNANQLFTWMAVDDLDGSINIVFLDQRAGEKLTTQAYLARSTDGGVTFSNLALSVPAFECSERGFFGDYNGIDAFGGRVVIGFPRIAESGVELIGYWTQFPTKP
ncbi:MAG: exo-alpha-sialidase [Acidobacteria bacterium]|nr:exo-alpha-sialidase [Acidobacteriota bacterium]MCB9399298.1 exo-alpha-sialidase [Acidobacteriota bacterium]